VVGRYVKLEMHTTSSEWDGGYADLGDFSIYDRSATPVKYSISTVLTYNNSNNTYTTNTIGNCSKISKNLSCAFDSNATGTWWHAISAKPWIDNRPSNTQQNQIIDLGAVKAIGKISLTSGPSSTYYSPEYYIYVSSDPTTVAPQNKRWTRIYGTALGTSATNNILFP
jgi:hypothetical protein